MSKRPDSGSFWTICAFLADFLIFICFITEKDCGVFSTLGIRFPPFLILFFLFRFMFTFILGAFDRVGLL
jgi:hypothetical protein